MALLDDYLTIVELAEQLRCSRRTVARYEKLKNGLPSVMIGGRKLYRLASVKAWLESRERYPNPGRST